MNQIIAEECRNLSSLLSDIENQPVHSLKTRIYGMFQIIGSELRREAPGMKESLFSFCEVFDEGIMHRRTRRKPLGYAGDYLTIDYIYTEKTDTHPRGRHFDRLFHQYEASEAVRNRKRYFIQKCRALARNSESGQDVLSVASGSCRDVSEAHLMSRHSPLLHFHCVDQEPDAVAYARHLMRGTPTEYQSTLECANIFRWKSPRRYDLIWCAGLFDYLNDRAAVFLIRKLYAMLKPGGQLIFGNFSPKNPTRMGMELGSQWVLIHRDAHELIGLCLQAEIGFSKIQVESEPLGINLFCNIQA
ncbi:class I SAM-dependent methyltransferase [bacterium]|nr:class I SAM-dependent methyltransferase [bacterium]